VKAQKFAQKKGAVKEIESLFGKAKDAPSLAKRYVRLARRISMKFKVRIPDIYRRSFCKECNAFLVQGKNCSIRKRKTNIVIHCKDCGSVRRISVR